MSESVLERLRALDDYLHHVVGLDPGNDITDAIAEIKRKDARIAELEERLRKYEQ